MNGLAGKRVVITRAPHQSEEFAVLLRKRGAIPLLYPCIDIAPPDDPSALDTALREAIHGVFDWLVLTSVNTVVALEKRMAALGLHRLPDTLRLAAVGSATEHAAQHSFAKRVSIVPETYTAEALAETLDIKHGERVFLPQSALADTSLADALRAKGAHVVAIGAYRTVMGSGGVDLPALLRENDVDVITFTSGSTVHNCLTRLDGQPIPAGVVIGCIGTKTADIAQQYGLNPSVVPNEHTLDGLTDALAMYFSGVPHVD